MAEPEQLTTSPPPEVHSVDLQAEESSLVDDVIFGGNEGSVSEVFDEPETPIEPELAVTTEESQPQGTPLEQPPADNNEVRYQYWQSQADKLKNERDQIQQQFNQLAVNNQALPETQQAEEAEPEIEFPDPPEKPHKPYNFSMDEAMSDPSSESAKFVQSEQTWRDEMDDHKNLQFEYQMAMLQDERDEMQVQRQQDIQRSESERQQAAQVSTIKEQVMNQYQVDSQVADDFVRVMSDPSSISMDNLWKLYASDKGLGSPAPTVNTPSGDFQQVQRAQQIPASMGVMPSQNRQNEDSIEEKIIDSMITDYNKQNPFN